MNPSRALALTLFALALLYAAWPVANTDMRHAVLAIAALPAALGVAALLGWKRSGFTAGVLALLWFSHGVMTLWSTSAERVPATLETLLALVVIYAACLPGIRARRDARLRS